MVGLQFHWPASTVVHTSDVGAGVKSLLEHAPDLVVVDSDLPDGAAFRALNEIRAASTVPVIALVADGNEDAVAQSLNEGADTCVSKPFGLLVLIARTKALLRRARSRPDYGDADFVCGDLTMDFVGRTVTRGGARVKLTPTEYKVLYHLVRNVGRVTTKESLSRMLWDEERASAGDHLKVFICRLRAKIEPEDGTRLIVTERTRGYRFVVPNGAPRASA